MIIKKTKKKIMLWIKRILLGFFLLITLLLTALVSTVVIDGLLSANDVAALTNTRIATTDGVEFGAYVARPSTPGPHPAVIMIHEFWGLRAEIIGKADDLAAQGYVVIAPDLFRGSSAKWVPRAIYQVVSTPPERLTADLDTVFAWLGAQAEVDIQRVAIMGFCFGGGTSLRYSLHNPQLAGTIILYGSLITDTQQLKALSGPVLGIFGDADQSIPVSEVRAFEAALNELGVKNKISIYADQPHAFVQSIEAIRQGGAQGQAWAEVHAFLKETLQPGGTSQRRVEPLATTSAPNWGYWLMLAYEHTMGMRWHGSTH